MNESEKSGKILIIEDDREIAGIVSINIQDLGFETEIAYDGHTGFEKADRGFYALIILDLMLPQMDGITVCRKIREKDSRTPILMLTAKAEEIDRIIGLELGADDYMTKPFSVREMLARVRAILRRSQSGIRPYPDSASSAGSTITRGDLMMDFDKRKVIVRGRVQDLTVKEFELLSLFIRNPGRTYSRSDLLNLVWGYQFEGYEHTVNTHINRLRNKIEEDPARPEYLETVWGIGYRFSENQEDGK